MSRTVALTPRVSAEEEMEQLDDMATSGSNASLHASGSAGYFSSLHSRSHSAGTPTGGTLSASLSQSSSFGSLVGSMPQTFLRLERAAGSDDLHYAASSRGHDYEPYGASMSASASVASHSGTETPAAGLYSASVNASVTNAALRYRKPFAQRVLRQGEKPEKPWLHSKKRQASNRKSYWVFVLALCVGLVGSALLMYFAYASVPKGKYCLVFDEQFEGTSINKDIWFHEVEAGGFGNGQFDSTTDSTNNSFVQDGKLYIVPTLTADALGDAAITNGYTLNLTQSGACTAANKTSANCVVASNLSTGQILPPIQSARLMTNFSRSIKYGRVEVKARMPTGDWIWPAVWMMPKDSVYGAWPRSGEIDIFEGRGNVAKTRDGKGTNQMSSSLHFGPSPLFDGYGFATRVRTLWRNLFNQRAHTFGLEWTESELWTWEGSRIFRNLEVPFGDGFWKRGRFPYQMANGTLLANPWAGVQGPHANAAPFDQEFYLILNVAVGGTNGYFQDGQGDMKPWSNDAKNAASQFWLSKDTWLPSWPKDPKQRGMEIEYVKMWQKC
ncbi:related to beta-1,3-glucan binding protein [Sporisorium reilianum SRZ2]|uniref:Related to beta-1,3-glucan binding protein n=1 Tax=Sporisorium reilianum (strain SRZ2) TaxID=999809 RepID=E6ZM02_SPORE|nr:related to beta-1,3-glucan binding protein [Sporisorium reilianum SRZ2]